MGFFLSNWTVLPPFLVLFLVLGASTYMVYRGDPGRHRGDGEFWMFAFLLREREAQYAGQLAGVGVEGLLETFNCRYYPINSTPGTGVCTLALPEAA